MYYRWYLIPSSNELLNYSIAVDGPGTVYDLEVEAIAVINLIGGSVTILNYSIVDDGTNPAVIKIMCPSNTSTEGFIIKLKSDIPFTARITNLKTGADVTDLVKWRP